MQFSCCKFSPADNSPVGDSETIKLPTWGHLLAYSTVPSVLSVLSYEVKSTQFNCIVKRNKARNGVRMLSTFNLQLKVHLSAQ